MYKKSNENGKCLGIPELQETNNDVL